MVYTYEDFTEALDRINKGLKDSLKFEQLAKTLFADTNKESVVININGINFYRFGYGRKITLNLKPDGSVFFETNIDKDYYDENISECTYYENFKIIEKFINYTNKSFIIDEYFSPVNIYLYYSHNIINRLIDYDYKRWNDLFDIRYDLRDLKNAKLVTYSKVKSTTDYKIKFKPSGNVYQLHYFTAPMARNFDGIEFFKAELDSYSKQYNDNKALMVEALLIGIYNEAKLIKDKILPDIELAKAQIIDHYKTSQVAIERDMRDSFNAYVSDVTNPVGYYMLYNDGNWDVVKKSHYNSFEKGDYNNHTYVKYDRFQNRLLDLHLQDVSFDKALDYYIAN